MITEQKSHQLALKRSYTPVTSTSTARLYWSPQGTRHDDGKGYSRDMGAMDCNAAEKFAYLHAAQFVQVDKASAVRREHTEAGKVQEKTASPIDLDLRASASSIPEGKSKHQRGEAS